jgi:hypothetical protein
MPDGCGYSYGLSVCARGGVRRSSRYGFRVGTGSVVTMLPDARAAVIILANRNGAIFGRTERAVLAQLVSLSDASPLTAQTGAPPATAVPGTYANGPDTLRVVAGAGGALRYRYGRDDYAARYDPAAGALVVLDAQGGDGAGVRLRARRGERAVVPARRAERVRAGAVERLPVGYSPQRHRGHRGEHS